MALNGLIRQFSSYTDQNLEQMKADLGIKMPIPKLRVCATYFGKKAFRDPYIEELHFLDLFWETVSCSPAALTPRELLTNDAFVAETYADLMQKYRELSPNAQKPCTLSESFRLISGYLTRIGKTTSCSNQAFSFEDTHSLPGITESEEMLSSPTARFALRCMPKRTVPFAQTDVLVLLIPNQSLSNGEYALVYNAFFTNSELTDLVKATRMVGKHGLLYESLHLAQGVNIQMDRLSTSGEDLPLSALITAHQGAYMMRIAASDIEQFTKGAKAIGLRALPYASVKDASAVILSRGSTVELSWSAQFIRSFFALTPVSLHLKNESAGELASIDNRFHKVGNSMYIAGHADGTRSTRAVFGAQTYAISHVAPNGAFFRNALDTALSSILSLAVCGISYSDQGMAIHLSQPASGICEEIASDMMSSILGLSRLEAELSVPMTFGTIDSDSNASSPEITAIAYAKGESLPDCVTSVGSRIYCVMPEYTENGIPDFDRLRELLSWLESTAKTGTFKSARVLCRQTLSQALQEMSTDELTCIPCADVSVDTNILRLAILLETEEELQLRPVATVSEAQPQEIEDPAHESLSEEECMIFGDRQQVVLLANPEDRDAQVLSHQLAMRGAAVLSVAPDYSPEKLASALLQSQTLIVCKNVTLPTDNRFLQFALDTLSRANGNILSFETVTPAKIKNVISIQNGISEEILDQIAKKAN